MARDEERKKGELARWGQGNPSHFFSFSSSLDEGWLETTYSGNPKDGLLRCDVRPAVDAEVILRPVTRGKIRGAERCPRGRMAGLNWRLAKCVMDEAGHG